MVAKDKAEQLFFKFLNNTHNPDEEVNRSVAKRIVILMVEDILQSDRVCLSKMDRGWWEQVLIQAHNVDMYHRLEAN